MARGFAEMQKEDCAGGGGYGPPPGPPGGGGYGPPQGPPAGGGYGPPPGGGYGRPPGYAPPPGGQGGGFAPPPAGNTPYGYGAPVPQPGAPYGVHPTLGIPYSDKQKQTAGIVQLAGALLVGLPGIGRLYIGHTGLGIAQLVSAVAGIVLTIITCGIGAFLLVPIVLWGVIDGILMLTNDDLRDAQGRPLR